MVDILAKTEKRKKNSKHFLKRSWIINKLRRDRGTLTKSNFFAYTNKFFHVNASEFKKDFYIKAAQFTKAVKEKYKTRRVPGPSRSTRFNSKLDKYVVVDKNNFFNFIKRRLATEHAIKTFVNSKAIKFISFREYDPRYSRKAKLSLTNKDRKTKKRVHFGLSLIHRFPKWFGYSLLIDDARSYRTRRTCRRITKMTKFFPNPNTFYWKLFNSRLTVTKEVPVYRKKKISKNKEIEIYEGTRTIIDSLWVKSSKWKKKFWIRLVTYLNNQKNSKKNRYQTWIQLRQPHVEVYKDADVNMKTGAIKYAKTIVKISHKNPLVKSKLMKKNKKCLFKKTVNRWLFNNKQLENTPINRSFVPINI